MRRSGSPGNHRYTPRSSVPSSTSLLLISTAVLEPVAPGISSSAEPSGMYSSAICPMNEPSLAQPTTRPALLSPPTSAGCPGASCSYTVNPPSTQLHACELVSVEIKSTPPTPITKPLSLMSSASTTASPGGVPRSIAGAPGFHRKARYPKLPDAKLEYSPTTQPSLFSAAGPCSDSAPGTGSISSTRYSGGLPAATPATARLSRTDRCIDELLLRTCAYSAQTRNAGRRHA